MVKSKIEKYRQQGVNLIAVEVPLLLEAGWGSLVDEIWVTVAPEDTVLKRLHQRTGLSERESRARINSQLSTEERIRHANVVIDTDCDFTELRTKVKEALATTRKTAKD